MRILNIIASVDLGLRSILRTCLRLFSSGCRTG